MLKGLLAELLFGNIGVEIPTYVRNDNYGIPQQVESTKSVSNGKRLNWFLERNRVVGKQLLVELGVFTQKAEYFREFNKRYRSSHFGKITKLRYSPGCYRFHNRE